MQIELTQSSVKMTSSNSRVFEQVQIKKATFVISLPLHLIKHVRAFYVYSVNFRSAEGIDNAAAEHTSSVLIGAPKRTV